MQLIFIIIMLEQKKSVCVFLLLDWLIYNSVWCFGHGQYLAYIMPTLLLPLRVGLKAISHFFYFNAKVKTFIIIITTGPINVHHCAHWSWSVMVGVPSGHSLVTCIFSIDYLEEIGSRDSRKRDLVLISWMGSLQNLIWDFRWPWWTTSSMLRSRALSTMVCY
jgi:hypothetical protein